MGSHNTKPEELHSRQPMQLTIFLRIGFDPIEKGVRERVRGFIEELIEGEAEEALSRPRYGRAPLSGAGNAPCVRPRRLARSRSRLCAFGSRRQDGKRSNGDAQIRCCALGARIGVLSVLHTWLGTHPPFARPHGRAGRRHRARW
jgi:hypothetical protein